MRASGWRQSFSILCGFPRDVSYLNRINDLLVEVSVSYADFLAM